jgi:predicted ATPase
MRAVLLQSIKARNILSFGSEAKLLPLAPLNVLIGPNGSGKSNLIDVVALLRATTGDLAGTIARGGGTEWAWKGRPPGAQSEIKAIVEPPAGSPHALRYRLTFRADEGPFAIASERIDVDAGDRDSDYYYRFEDGAAEVRVRHEKRRLPMKNGQQAASILTQLRDEHQYPEITFIGIAFGSVRIYRDWVFGANAPARRLQRANQGDEFLVESCENLAVVMRRLLATPAEQEILAALREFYPEVTGLEVTKPSSDWCELVLRERFAIPASRLSDGTLRFLCLLAVLCDPDPPPLVCLEEPELGMHPDVMPVIARLLRKASERTQWIVTTHSDVLIDSLTETPESVVVCEKVDGSTCLRRLERAALEQWLKEYRLGALWTKGVIGGNRW